MNNAILNRFTRLNHQHCFLGIPTRLRHFQLKYQGLVESDFKNELLWLHGFLIYRKNVAKNDVANNNQILNQVLHVVYI